LGSPGGLAMRNTVADGRGHIGAVLDSFFRAAKHEASRLDLGTNEGHDLGPGPQDIRMGSPRGLRDAKVGQRTRSDAVMCLAAPANDPLSHLNPALSATLFLAAEAARARVRAAPSTAQAARATVRWV